MSFIIGFIGIFIYMSVYFYKKECDKQFERKSKSEYISYKYLENDWLEKVTDSELEYKIKSTSYINDNRDLIYGEVMYVLNKYTGFNEKFNSFDSFRFYMEQNHHNTIERILMAKNGKLLYDDAKYGILSPPVYNSKMIEIWNINNDIMRWIDKTLKSNGIKYDMKFINGSNVDKVKYNKDLSCPVDNIYRPIGGKYYWEPIIKNV